ncbi:MAG: preprotein translocase subunit SecG [Clostridiaceae bacterium]|jgi:preprotein translocase subunit SecG|nr:preprotein translocase subunit SecG [Clostridiaceae bacterium]
MSVGVFMQTLLAATSGVSDSGISYEARQAASAALIILMVVLSIAMIIVVMMQKGTSDNVSAITGATDTYYGKNKKQATESIKKRVTFVIFGLLLVTSVVFFIIRVI